MTLSEAISIRSSIRSYLPEPLSPGQRKQLEKEIRHCSQRGGLHLQLLCGDGTPFASLFKNPGILRGVRNCLLLAGPEGTPHLEEKCGYYGEEIVLTATAMGLGTCWVGGTYDRKRCMEHLGSGEELVCVIALGAGQEEPRQRAYKSGLASGGEDAPAWFQAGAAAVERAPSALNRQEYHFAYQPDGTVQASLTRQGAFSLVDLGIAKQHFELGAHGGQWSWGDGGIFRKAVEEKSCGAVVWRKRDGRREYLLARHNGGHWSFPKGHVENAETEAETAQREILEETGLLAEIDPRFRQQVTYYPKPGVVKDVIFFTARPVEGQEHAQESEIAEIGWFSFQRACALVTYATDEEVLLAAEAYLK